VLSDEGKKVMARPVSDRLNRGEQTLAADLVFTGDAAPKEDDLEEFPLMMATTGERALGIEGAQLIALAQWLKNNFGAQTIRVESLGIRNQVVALVAADLAPGLFSELAIRGGMPSFRYLLDTPVKFESAPDLFCLDLYKQFDIGRLASIAEPARVTQQYR
jgi:hypothetical protein